MQSISTKMMAMSGIGKILRPNLGCTGFGAVMQGSAPATCGQGAVGKLGVLELVNQQGVSVAPVVFI